MMTEHQHAPAGLPGRSLMRAFFSKIEQVTGFVLTRDRQASLETALAEQGAASAGSDAQTIVRTVLAGAPVPDALLEALVVSESYFFRHPGQFEFIRDTVLPALLVEGHRPLQIWCAGCAAGQEAWSMAILVHQMGLDHRDVRIFGTDLSEANLARARQARYRAWAFREAWPGLDRYLREEDGERILDTRELAKVRFRRLNLREVLTQQVPELESTDLILCRNVFIYFGLAAIDDIVDRMADCLSPQGWMLLAPADPLLTNRKLAGSVSPTAGLVYRRAVDARTVFPRPPANTVAAHSSATDAGYTQRSEAWAAASAASAQEPTPRERALNALRAGDYALAFALVGSHPPQVGSQDFLALELVEEAQKARPLDPALHYFQAALLMSLDRHDAAEAPLRRLIYLDPRSILGHYLLGRLRLRQGDSSGAQLSFRNARDLSLGLPPEEPVGYDVQLPAGSLARTLESELEQIQRNGNRGGS